MKQLVFKVNSQSLQRLDNFKPAAGSVEYLTASFEFSSDWSGTTKTAKCRVDSSIYDATINSSGVCTIPWEVLAVDTAKQIFGKQCFHIWVEGISGTKTITTGEIKIELNVQGAGNEVNASDPTPSVYAQFVEDVKADTKASADIATAQAESATASAESAAASAASLKNDYSNALKGNASGAVIRLDDVSPVEHLPVVKVHGKNLIDYTKAQARTSAYTVTIDESNNAVIFSGNYYFKIPVSIEKGKTVAFSCVSDKYDGYWIFEYEDGSLSVYTVKESKTTEKAVKSIFVYKSNSTVTEENMVFKNMQLEYGETATEYTPYVDPSTATVTDSDGNTYTPNTDGTVEGITSTMIKNGISTETEGMTIECKYNRDINKVIADIMTQLAGG